METPEVPVSASLRSYDKFQTALHYLLSTLSSFDSCTCHIGWHTVDWYFEDVRVKTISLQPSARPCPIVVAKASATETPNGFQFSDNKKQSRDCSCLLAGIPSKTKGVLISLRGQQIALGPQTNDKLRSPTELNGSFALVIAEISRKTKGVFAYPLARRVDGDSNHGM